MSWPLLHQFEIEDHCEKSASDAIVWKTGSITHQKLREAVHQVAGRLQSMEIGRGHRVAVYLPKCVEAVQLIGPVSRFIQDHPTTRMLALSFLLLVGMALIADGLHYHIPRGYLYFAIAFSMVVEALNLAASKRRRKQHALAE